MATYDSELAKKLNLKSEMAVRVVGKPAEVELDGLRVVDDPGADGVLVFLRDQKEADKLASVVREAAKAGKVTWMAYPKAKQLGTDLNRDILWQTMQPHGIEPNRQISIDEVWSAMRFRPQGG